MIAVREFSSAAECIAHANAVHRKFYATEPKPRPVIAQRLPEPPASTFVPKFLHLMPSWKREALYFDAHVSDWRLELLARVSPVKAYIRRRAGELGYTYGDMMVKIRSRDRIYAKHTIIWEIKRLVKPSITLQELAGHFGLDHSSVVNALRKVDVRKSSELAGIALQPKEGE